MWQQTKHGSEKLLIRACIMSFYRLLRERKVMMVIMHIHELFASKREREGEKESFYRPLKPPAIKKMSLVIDEEKAFATTANCTILSE